MTRHLMFDFVTHKWTPMGGECEHKCAYCYRVPMIEQYGIKKYFGPPQVSHKLLKKKFPPGSYVFLCHMTDLLAFGVTDSMIRKVLTLPRNNPDSTFLVLTKNVTRYHHLLKMYSSDVFPDNIVFGATIESDQFHYPIHGRYKGLGESYDKISQAESPLIRLFQMRQLYLEQERYKMKQPRMIVVEPILDFDNVLFPRKILYAKPDSVAVGYDNYDHNLPEPSLEKTMALIKELETYTHVHRKVLRKAWWENV